MDDRNRYYNKLETPQGPNIEKQVGDNSAEIRKDGFSNLSNMHTTITDVFFCIDIYRTDTVNYIYSLDFFSAKILGLYCKIHMRIRSCEYAIKKLKVYLY